jgi:hypothetical protein
VALSWGPGTVDDMQETSLVRKPRFDHPLPVFLLVTFTLALLAMSVTFNVLAARSAAAPCDEQIGRFRMHISQTQPPSIFDTAAWDTLTDRYNALFDVCDSAVAGAFTAEEFDPWAKPALAPFQEQMAADNTQGATSTTPPTPSTSPSTTTPANK